MQVIGTRSHELAGSVVMWCGDLRVPGRGATQIGWTGGRLVVRGSTLQAPVYLRGRGPAIPQGFWCGGGVAHPRGFSMHAVVRMPAGCMLMCTGVVYVLGVQ